MHKMSLHYYQQKWKTGKHTYQVREMISMLLIQYWVSNKNDYYKDHITWKKTYNANIILKRQKCRYTM